MGPHRRGAAAGTASVGPSPQRLPCPPCVRSVTRTGPREGGLPQSVPNVQMAWAALGIAPVGVAPAEGVPRARGRHGPRGPSKQNWENSSRATLSGTLRTALGLSGTGWSPERDPTGTGSGSGRNGRGSPARFQESPGLSGRRCASAPKLRSMRRYSSNGYSGSHPPRGSIERRAMRSWPFDSSVRRLLKNQQGGATFQPTARRLASSQSSVRKRYV